MRRRINLISRETLSRRFGSLEEIAFDYQHSDGVWRRYDREVYDRGNSAAVLLFCPEKDTVILVRQFRLAMHLQGDANWSIEVCGGILDGDDFADCARREAEEEAGFRIRHLHFAFAIWLSPAALGEKVHCFVGTYSDEGRVSEGGGLAQEGEEIEVLEMPRASALDLVKNGTITDARTIALLQYLALHRVEILLGQGIEACGEPGRG